MECFSGTQKEGVGFHKVTTLNSGDGSCLLACTYSSLQLGSHCPQTRGWTGKETQPSILSQLLSRALRAEGSCGCGLPGLPQCPAQALPRGSAPPARHASARHGTARYLSPLGGAQGRDQGMLRHSEPERISARKGKKGGPHAQFPFQKTRQVLLGPGKYPIPLRPRDLG